ncbi:type I-C CRISPR-associated endonuclease Cas1c [Myxococcota bacterium]|nr:type I-C CRISPR-associated endonuclease Cas1c [Myxococcota bacterium]MBU1512174.1 type I-C CRISPR-associated endonuclease Cas1c [Myxococcota bacterium]
MKKHLNTLFVTTQGAYLHLESEAVVVRVEKEIKLRVPVLSIAGIVCFGNVLVSPPLMGFCAEKQVGLTFLSEYGRFLARVQGPVSGNVLLRKAQYRASDDAEAAPAVARSFLTGKLLNSRTVLQRALRDHGDKLDRPRMEEAVERLKIAQRHLEAPQNLDSLRGVEGDAAGAYFDVFDMLITTDRAHFSFDGRNRRPPRDRINCMLSFVYTILMHDVRSALEGVGLDPQVGFLHRDRPGRPGLALDMMEEFRPLIADRLVLSLVNLGKVRAGGFLLEESGVTMDDATRKAVLVAYQERKKEELTHPFLGEKVALGVVFHLQALLLARHLRGDLDAYPPFVLK